MGRGSLMVVCRAKVETKLGFFMSRSCSASWLGDLGRSLVALG